MITVLVATHNHSTAKYLKNSMKKAGYQQTVVTNCLDAWRETSQSAYDVLLVDLAMPGLDGFIIAQNGLQSNPDLNVIFINGFAGVTLDTYGWAAAGGAPLTSAPFHLCDAVSHIRFLTGQGGLPYRYTTQSADNIIYADFSTRQQAAQMTTT